MKMIKIDLSPFSPETQEEYRKKIRMFAFDDYFTLGHPEIFTVAWDRKKPIEETFPELAPHLTYL